MGGVDHSEENCESGSSDVASELDIVDSGSPIRTKALHFVGLHDRMRSVEPPVTDKRKEGEGSLAKLERFVVLEYVTDTANEWWVCRVEVLESFDGDGTGCVR